MKFNKVVGLVLPIFFVGQTWAQTSLSEEIKNELLVEDSVNQPIHPVDNGELVRVRNVPMVKAGQRVYVQPQQVVQQQPTTYVEASPLNESRAEQIRRIRQEAELKTEEKIVEKLETSRLKDEKDRADRLFGNKFEAPQATAVEAQPVAVAVEERASESEREDIRKEVLEAVRTEIQETKAEMADVQEGKKEEVESFDPDYYLSILGGVNTYDMDSIESDKSFGIAFGVEVSPQLFLEARVQRSTFELDRNYSRLTDMTQTSFGGGMKYVFTDAKFRPYLAAGVSSTQRKYERGNQTYRYQFDEEVTRTFDANFAGGFEIDLSKSFAIGAEIRYFTSLSKPDEVDLDYLLNPYNNNALESTDHYMVGISGRLQF